MGDWSRVVESAEPAEPGTTHLLDADEALHHSVDSLATDLPCVPEAGVAV